MRLISVAVGLGSDTFFNPTRPDGQDSKPSPRVRAPELAQGSGSDGPAMS
jgi:hypothetical protein